MDADSLRVDIADIEDVRAQLPRARAILARKRQALERCQADHDSFLELVELLAKRAGVDMEDSPQRHEPAKNGSVDGTSSDVALVVAVVNRANRAIRAKTVKTMLANEGHILEGDKVRDALYYAANRRKPPLIQSLPERGYYAPVNFRRSEQDAIFSNGSETSPTETGAASGGGP